MNIGVTTIITNEYNEILLIQRNDTHSWAPPGGSLDQGETPVAGIIREVEEETGLRIVPVRLASLDYWPIPGRPHLQFVFRSLKSGGEIRTSDESIQVNYFKRRSLPKPMLSLHREVIETGWLHAGQPIWQKRRAPWELLPRWLWLRFVVYPRFERERKRKGEPPYVPPPKWKVSGRVIIPSPPENKNVSQQEIGHVWVRSDGADWVLPGGSLPDDQPPWDVLVTLVQNQTGLQVELKRLAGVFVEKESPTMIVVWEAEPVSHQTLKETASYKKRGSMEGVLTTHLEMVDCLDAAVDEIEYKVLS